MFLDMVCKAPPLTVEVDGDLSVGLRNERQRGLPVSCNNLPGGTVLDNHLVFTVCRSIPVFGVLIHVHTDDSLAL